MVRPASPHGDIEVELRELTELNVGAYVFACESLGPDRIPFLLELEFFTEAIGLI